MDQKLRLQIRALRKAKNVTQKELAKALHVSFQTISKWENGVAMPDISYLPILAMYFEVDVEVILGMRPLEHEVTAPDYTSKKYWEQQMECTKDWKLFYFNDDYLEFLVKKVWRFDGPIDMLDCACGYGYLAEKIFPYLPEGSTYTGFDASEMYLEEGRKRFGKENPAIQFVKGNILDYKSPKKYDLVISQMILSYLPDPESAIDRMLQALKPGGMLAAIDISLPLAEDGFFIARGNKPYKPNIPNPNKVWEHMQRQGTMNIQTGTEMAFLFRKKGLRHVDARLSDKVFIYDGNSPEGREEEFMKYRNVVQNLERVEQKYAFYLDRGCSLPETEAYMKYQEDVLQLLQERDIFVSKASGLYITWGRYMEE